MTKHISAHLNARIVERVTLSDYGNLSGAELLALGPYDHVTDMAERFAHSSAAGQSPLNPHELVLVHIDHQSVDKSHIKQAFSALGVHRPAATDALQLALCAPHIVRTHPIVFQHPSWTYMKPEANRPRQWVFSSYVSEHGLTLTMARHAWKWNSDKGTLFAARA